MLSCTGVCVLLVALCSTVLARSQLQNDEEEGHILGDLFIYLNK